MWRTQTIAPSGNMTIRKMRLVGTNRAVTTFAGGDAAGFYYPQSVAVDGAGNVYVADTGNLAILKITQVGTVKTLAGEAGQIGSANGSGSSARFDEPMSVALDSATNVF
jgi:DNA-binding beta-propeller fold protein YncE